EKNNLLSKENEELMGTIEELKGENERLYKLLEGAKEDLENEIDRNNILYMENKELISINERLKDERDELYSYISNLEWEIEELMDRLKKGNVLEPEKSEELEESEALGEPGPL